MLSIVLPVLNNNYSDINDKNVDGLSFRDNQHRAQHSHSCNHQHCHGARQYMEHRCYAVTQACLTKQVYVAAADAHLLQRCLAKLILWKDQLLQHCTDHESAMRQYSLEVDSAMAQQEQRLLGQAANILQQRDAALSALHRMEEEVQHYKVMLAVGTVVCPQAVNIMVQGGFLSS